MDEPKSLRSADARAQRLAAVDDHHIAPLTEFVRSLRARMGTEYAIPYFDPFDGGTRADCLFLLEAPGPKAIASQFISRDNPDETAKNVFLLSREAGIGRHRTVLWNVVPWYIGTGKKSGQPTRGIWGLRRPRSLSSQHCCQRFMRLCCSEIKQQQPSSPSRTCCQKFKSSRLPIPAHCSSTVALRIEQFF